MPIPLLILGGGLAVSGGIALLRFNYKKRAKERAVVAAIIHENQAKKKAAFLSLIVTHRLLTRQHNRETDRNLVVSGVAIGVNAASKLLYGPLCWIGIPLILYNSHTIFNDALEGLLIKRKLRASVIDSIAIIGTLVIGCYFVAAVMGGLYFLGQKLLQKSRDQGHALIRIRPSEIWRWQEGIEVESTYESIRLGDEVVVNVGETIPFDGIIVAGSARVDQHMLTGEAQAKELTVGDNVLAMTVLNTGKLRVKVEKTAGHTVAEQVYRTLSYTSDSQASLEACSTNVADRLSWPTLALGGVVAAMFGPITAVGIASNNFSRALLIILPIGVLNYQRLARQQGINIKDGRTLELLNEVNTVVFDKSSLLSLKEHEIKQIYSWQRLDENELLRLAAAASKGQTHPLAKGIKSAASKARLKLPKAKPSKDAPQSDNGVVRLIKGEQVQVGSMNFMVEQGIAREGVNSQLELDCLQRGNSLLYVALDGDIMGAIELQLSLRPEAKNTIRALRKRGLGISIVSGDRRKPTRRIAEALYIENYHETLDAVGMASYVDRMQTQGKKICFVGDGINNAIAMKKAQVSITFEAASAAAQNSANIVMRDHTLDKLDGLFEFADDFNNDMKTNIAVSMLPAAFGVAGLLFFRLNIYSALSLYVMTLGISTLNTVLPPFRTRKVVIMGNNFDTHNKKSLSMQAEKLVRKFAFNSGLTGFIPIPMLDLVGLVSVQRTMVYRLCKLYEVPFSLKLAKTLLSAMTSTLAWNVAAPVVGSVFKIVPGVGVLVGGAGSAAVGSASTYASGKVFQKHFENGGNLEDFDLEAAKRLFTSELRKGKSLSESKESD